MLGEINYQKLCGFKWIKERDTIMGSPPNETNLIAFTPNISPQLSHERTKLESELNRLK